MWKEGRGKEEGRGGRKRRGKKKGERVERTGVREMGQEGGRDKLERDREGRSRDGEEGEDGEGKEGRGKEREIRRGGGKSEATG